MLPRLIDRDAGQGEVDSRIMSNQLFCSTCLYLASTEWVQSTIELLALHICQLYKQCAVDKSHDVIKNSRENFL